MFKRVLESNAYGKLLGSYRDKIFITIIVAVIGLSVAVMLGQQWILNKQNQRIFDLTQQIVNLTKSDDVFIPQLTRVLRSIIK
jgi:vancomycin permeability regulator SanA